VRAENGLTLSLDEVREAVGKSDVLILGFLHLAPRVLFDTRPGTGGPLFRLVSPVRGPQERFAQLRKLRPGLGEPERFVFIQWPLGMQSLVESGVWERIVGHCETAAGPRGAADCEGILSRLRQLDRKEEREAITGDSYRTIWPQHRKRTTGS
jgi:hypothetical protein